MTPLKTVVDHVQNVDSPTGCYDLDFSIPAQSEGLDFFPIKAVFQIGWNVTCRMILVGDTR